MDSFEKNGMPLPKEFFDSLRQAKGFNSLNLWYGCH
jgi:hypothetical protein